MNAKEYLQQAYYADRHIKDLMDEVGKLRKLSQSVQSLDISSNTKPTGVSDKVGLTVAKIIDLENEINAEIDRYVDLKREIRERIESVENEKCRLVLQKRYLNFQRWKIIAKEMFYGLRSVKRFHDEALAEIGNRFF